MDARTLLKSCTNPIVRDHLTRKRGTAFGLAVAPSAPVVRDLYKKDIEEARYLAAIISDTDLLNELCGKEKRATVIRAFARNPHLPAEWRNEYRQRAETKRDQTLLTNLMLSDQTLEAQRIALGFTPLGRGIDESQRAEVLQREVSRRVLDLLDEPECPTGAAEVLGEAWSRLTFQGSEDVRLFIEAASKTRNQVLKSNAIAEALPILESHETLKEFGGNWQNVHVAILRERIERGIDITAQEVLGAITAESTNLAEVLSVLASHSILIGEEAAEALLDRALAAKAAGRHTYMWQRNYANLRVTPEAARVLVKLGEEETVKAYLKYVSDPEMIAVLAKGVASRTLRQIQLDPGLILQAWKAGLRAEDCIDLAGADEADLILAEKEPAFRRYLLLQGSVYEVTRFVRTLDDVKLVLERDEVQPGRTDQNSRWSIGRKVLSIPGLSTEERLQAVKLLKPEEIRRWLQGAQFPENPAQRGDFKNLLAWEPEIFAPNVLHNIAYSAGTSEGTAEDLLETYPIGSDFFQVASDVINVKITLRLEEAFGSDLDRWDTALSIGKNWDGTLETLVEACGLC